MDVFFSHKTARQQYSLEFKSKWKYPDVVKLKLVATINLINRATSLQDIICYKPFHFHKLQGKRKDEWSIYLGKTGYRITCIPCDNMGNIICGDIMFRQKSIQAIKVTGVTNHYE